MPATDQGGLAEAGRSRDEDEFALHTALHAVKEARAWHEVGASGRDKKLGRKEAEGHGRCWCGRRRNHLGIRCYGHGCQHCSSMVEPLKGEVLRLTEIGSMNGAVGGAVGLPVPAA